MTPKTLFAFELYLRYALKLSKIKRKSGGNMFRHQVETFAILLDSGYSDTVLLKAALIHDLIEELPSADLKEITENDTEGEAVLDLVREVSRRINGGQKEPKKEFLLRIMTEGSERAKLLKLADRLSNISSLCGVSDTRFIKKYTLETQYLIIPYASGTSESLEKELIAVLDPLQKTYKTN